LQTVWPLKAFTTWQYKWVTSIELVNAMGWAVPPYIILKVKEIQEGWYNFILYDWRLDCSENGWATHEIGTAVCTISVTSL